MSSYVSMESGFSDDVVELLWPLYDEGFKDINLHSPCRQSFNYGEFVAALKDPRVYRAVLRDDESNEMLAVAVWSNNFDHFPWLSAEYFKARYPEEFEAGRLYYTVATLSLNKRSGHMTKIMLEMTRRIAAERGRMLFDLCEELVNINWQVVIFETASSVVDEPLELENLGVQQYFSVGFKS
ncbi:hypothetical protein HYX70_04770 [Candidatus Saccharibacteria bacterium]|nr:hypothetical protein [Candidatus Saccharibacteria bacterium]